MTTRPVLLWPQALLYGATGVLKLVQTPQQLHDDLGFHWAGRFPAWSVRAIASAELAAAAVLTGHAVTGRGPARLAAGGLALLQVGAVTVNLAEGDRKPLPLNLGALALALASVRKGV